MVRALLGVTCLAVGLLAAESRAQTGRIAEDRRESKSHGWLSSYDEGRQRAREANRPLMVVLRCVP